MTFEHTHENVDKHVEREREREGMREGRSERVTFEHRNENKRCSACRERVVLPKL